MIILDKIKKSEAKHIIKLVEQMTRAEIIARLGPANSKDYAEYFDKSREIKEKLVEYIFGTSCLVKLGYRWNLIFKNKKKKRRRS